MLYQSDYDSLSDTDLLELIFAEGDRLPRSAVDEFIRRGEKFIPILGEIVSDYDNWDCDEPKWWAVVHATFILGTYKNKKTISYLLKAITFADSLEYAIVHDELPSIFGKLPPDILGQLEELVLTRYLTVTQRATAMQSMAALTIAHPETAERVFGFIARIMDDTTDDRQTRYFAGGVLLDFCLKKYQDKLVALGKEQFKRMEELVFTWEEVEEMFQKGKPWLDWYTRDWLRFYDEDKILERRHDADDDDNDQDETDN